MNKEEIDELAPEEERLEALHRTLAETAVPPELDIRAVVGGAVEAYWAGVERSNPRLTIGIEEYTAGWLRGASTWIRPLKEEFWRDAILAIVPVGLAFLTISIPTTRGLLPPRWVVDAGVLVPIVSGALLLLVVYRWRIESLRFHTVQHSLGALFGGLMIAALVGGWSVYQGNTTAGVSLDLAETKLSRVVLSSLENRAVNGEFLKVPSLAESSVVITVYSISPDRVIYRADSRELPGKLIADLGPSQGEIVWQSNRGDVRRLQVRVGTIEQSRRGAILLRQASGQNLHLNLNGLATVEPRTGRCAAVAYHSDDHSGSFRVSGIQDFDCAAEKATG